MLSIIRCKFKQLAVVTLALVLMAGCAPQTNEPAESNWQEITIDYGKPAAPVTLAYAYSDSIQAGENFELQIKFSSGTEYGTLEAEFNSEGGIRIDSQPAVSFDLQSDQKITTLNLTALANGRGYVNVSVGEYDAQGEPLLGKSFSIPIQIGPDIPAAKTKQQLPRGAKIMKDGEEEIIEMPAEVM